MAVHDLVISDIDALESKREAHLEAEDADYNSAFIRLENYCAQNFGKDSPMFKDLSSLEKSDFNDPEVYNRLRSYLGD